MIDPIQWEKAPVQAFSDTVTRAVMGRRIFITNRGHMGLAPSSIIVGDMVCVILGCQVPLIIRNVNRYQVLVGEAYVHGMMDDEVIEGLSRGVYKLKEFSLQ
jgi:hypothetical protein